MTLIQDQLQRDRALAPDVSFIVQAPAGSGKTELLTQRFLVLLAHVTQPEEILAITFTKKAAAEMRARIIKTLQSAHHDPEPTTAHAQKTWQLAKRALQQNEKLNWQLLANPNRLRIQTIDSFNTSLTNSLPMLAHFGAPPEITDDAESLYREAVQDFLSHLEEDVAWSDAIALLLAHRNNDLDKVQKLLVKLLGLRDQWLRHIAAANLRQELEAHLEDVVTPILQKVAKHFPIAHVNEFLTLIRFATSNIKHDKEHELFPALDLTALPSATCANLSIWQALKTLFITDTEAEWRKRFDKGLGFPAASSSKNQAEKALYAEMKERIENLIEKCKQYPLFLSALQELHYAPAIKYTENQWAVLNALYQILRVIAAQLKVTFRQHGKIDYIENALAAAAALGSDDAPTDLALALDYQIKHILIDEFQDTSNSQFHLLEKLLTGWETHDGRTLFIVGDPMQSIYRFREADVANFIRVREQGIANIQLEALTLAVNFRSTPIIVDWVNQAFPKVLPSQEDIATGAVTYSPSIANTVNHDNDSKIKTHVCTNAKTMEPKPVGWGERSEAQQSPVLAQALAIVELIQQTQQHNPNGSIAILVRARSHLKYLLPALKNAALLYQAIKIDSLDTRAAIQDLLALTRALLNPADRVAWLAILRAPWCGLSLQDLLIVGGNPSFTILETLTQPNLFAQLSSDGKQRLTRVLPILTLQMQERKRLDLSKWIETTWLLLGGAATLEHATELADVKTYLSLLKKLDSGCDLNAIDQLQQDIENLFAEPHKDANHTLQIMTIHNAKGLEFDTVILPFLEREPPNDKNSLLHWLEIPRQHAPNTLILAPLHATGDKADSIYKYVKKQLTIKTAHETGRLLYVAATRAKKQLHLFLAPKLKDIPEENSEGLKVESLLKKLYPAIAKDILMPEITTTPSAPEVEITTRCIKRLTSAWQNPLTQPAPPVIPFQTLEELQFTRETAKHIGIVVHLVLQQLSRNGIAWWQQTEKSTREIYLKNHLLQQGLLRADLTTAIKTVVQAIENTLQDARGLWILQAHTEQQSELALHAVIDNKVEKLILDRTFIDETGKRWIIDYKTEFFAGGNQEMFLAQEQQRHQEKMLKYHNAMLALDKKPIHLGLYFPLLAAWREWVVASEFVNI